MLIGKMFVGVAMSLSVLLSIEMFPTVIRYIAERHDVHSKLSSNESGEGGNFTILLFLKSNLTHNRLFKKLAKVDFSQNSSLCT